MPQSVNHDPVALDIDTRGVALLDAVTVQHGPLRDLGLYFLVAGAEAERLGVTVRVHNEFRSLVLANSRLQSSWGPLVPTFDPDASDLSPSTAHWLSCHNQAGELVACAAARRLLLGEGGLAEEFRSLRIFYADPAPHLAKGTHCIVEGEAAEVGARMQGSIAYSGAIWTRPDYRGRGIVYLMSRANRNLALTRWDTAYTASVTRVDLAAKGAIDPYGYRSARRIALHNSYRGDFDLSLIWVDRAGMEAELKDYVAAAKAARVIEAEETTSPARLAQGNINLS